MTAPHPNQPEPAACRPLEHLAAVDLLYPNAWGLIDDFRAWNGRGGLPGWPPWCFLPIVGCYAIVSREANVDKLPPPLLPDVARLAAVGAWRYTQGVYRFEPAVCEAVASAGIPRETPCETLCRLPDWCVYIETPGWAWGGMPLHGFFAHMDWDTGEERATLRLLLDGETGLHPCPVRLVGNDLAGSVSRATGKARRQLVGSGPYSGAAPEHEGADAIDSLEPLVSLVLFLCGDEADIVGQTDPPPGSPMPDPANESGQGIDPPGEAMADVFRWLVGRRPTPQQSQGLARKKTAKRGRKANKTPKLKGSADHAAH